MATPYHSPFCHFAIHLTECGGTSLPIDKGQRKLAPQDLHPFSLYSYRHVRQLSHSARTPYYPLVFFCAITYILSSFGWSRLLMPNLFSNFEMHCPFFPTNTEVSRGGVTRYSLVSRPDSHVLPVNE